MAANARLVATNKTPRLLCRHRLSHGNAVEFTTELSGAAVLTIPVEIAAQWPKIDRARIIVLTAEHPNGADWRAGAYQQFRRDDPQEDASYDSGR